MNGYAEEPKRRKKNWLGEITWPWIKFERPWIPAYKTWIDKERMKGWLKRKD